MGKKNRTCLFPDSVSSLFPAQNKTPPKHQGEKMLRGVLSAPARTALTATTSTSAATTAVAAIAVRTHVGAKGRCEYRLDYSHTMKRGPDALRDIKEGERKRALKNPTSKKEAMAH